MLVIGDKVVLHMPRCGGSSLRWALEKAGLTYRYSCEHAPFWSLPLQYKKLENVGVVRHPSEWYRSLFYYQCRLGRNSSSVLGYVLSSGFKSDDFTSFYANALDLPSFFANSNNLEMLKKRIKHIQMNKYTCWQVLNWPDVEDPLSGIAGKTLYEHWYNTVGLDLADNIFSLEQGFDWVPDFFGREINMQHRNAGNAPYFDVRATVADLQLYNRRPGQ